MDAYMEVVQLFWEEPDIILEQEDGTLWELMLQVHKLKHQNQQVAWRHISRVMLAIDVEVEKGRPTCKTTCKTKGSKKWIHK